MEKILHSGPGLIIGIPTLGRPVPLEWAFAFKSLNPPINYSVNIHVVRGKPVADARNEIAENALKVGAKYIFFLGDDVVVPGHTLRQLIFRLENNPTIDVVGGVYCAKADPAYPLVFRGNGQGAYWDWKIGEFFEVTGLGMDCTLIRTSILEKMSKPWFVSVDIDRSLDGINSAEQWTEDLYFLKKAADEIENFKVYCDGTVICEHWDVYGNPARYYSLPLDSLPMRQLITKKRKKILLVGENAVTVLDPLVEYVKYGNFEGADYRGTYESMPFESGEFDEVIIGSLALIIMDSPAHMEIERVQKKAA